MSENFGGSGEIFLSGWKMKRSLRKIFLIHLAFSFISFDSLFSFVAFPAFFSILFLFVFPLSVSSLISVSLEKLFVFLFLENLLFSSLISWLFCSVTLLLL